MTGENFLEGNAHDDLKCRLINEHRKEAHLARDILKVLGLSFGVLSLSCAKMLGHIEHLKPRDRGVMPSKGQTQNVQTLLNDHANGAILCARIETCSSECATFDSK